MWTTSITMNMFWMTPIEIKIPLLRGVKSIETLWKISKTEVYLMNQ